MIGILGGTFSPIHLGHLKIAEIALDLGVTPIHFVPSKAPPHRSAPEMSTADRIEMVRLSIDDNPQYILNLIEQERSGPSYMVDTLAELREIYGPDESMALLIGADTLQTLSSWHRWRELFDYAHVIVFSRPDHLLKPPAVLADYLTTDIKLCFSTPFGCLYCHPCNALPISSTSIRKAIGNNQDLTPWLPTTVIGYLQKKD